MNHTEQILLFYIMFMIVSIGIQMKILENGLLILLEIYSMWTSWDIHIGSCNKNFSIEGSFHLCGSD